MSQAPSTSFEQPTAVDPDDALRVFLAARDVLCPRCHYNLRGSSSSACPECGETIVLAIESRRKVAPIFFARLAFAWLIITALAIGIPWVRVLLANAMYQMPGTRVTSSPAFHWPTIPPRGWFIICWVATCGTIGLFGLISTLRPGLSHVVSSRWRKLIWLAGGCYSAYLGVWIHDLIQNWP